MELSNHKRERYQVELVLIADKDLLQWFTLSCVVVTPQTYESGNCHSHSVQTQHFGTSWKMLIHGATLLTLKIFNFFLQLVSKKIAANCRINTFICFLIAICSLVHVFIVYSIPAWNRALYKPVTSFVARQPPWEASLDNLNVTESEVCNLKGEEEERKKSKKQIWASELEERRDTDATLWCIHSGRGCVVFT